MISWLSIPSQVHGRNAEIGVTELTLDDVERNAFARHSNGVRVAELMRREAAPDPGLSSDAPRWRRPRL